MGGAGGGLVRISIPRLRWSLMAEAVLRRWGICKSLGRLYEPVRWKEPAAGRYHPRANCPPRRGAMKRTWHDAAP